MRLHFLLLFLNHAVHFASGHIEQVVSAESLQGTANESSSAMQSRRSLRNMYQWNRSGPRTGRLYCRVGIGFHLQIQPDGKVSGSHEANLFSILEIFAVSQGIVGIRGIFSNRFLAMSKKGKLHATTKFTADCTFRERYQENSYNTYASATYKSENGSREWYVALNKCGKVKKGNSPRVKPQHISTHFLPRFKQSEKEKTFKITKKIPEKKTPPKPPKSPPSVTASRKYVNVVKYRPKFRFG
ncbi:fibroblast growth factor 5 [Pristis pectinata]|uniref:fibroblast growth factor 5 n=1 Tax=Pristis pectinata TaxID=685728 RepID=UPI00223C985F|nr:fibroblast growth factor 5 [Pristis pectinata]